MIGTLTIARICLGVALWNDCQIDYFAIGYSNVNSNALMILGHLSK